MSELTSADMLTTEANPSNPAADSVEVRGDTVAAATATALEQLGAPPDQVVIEVLTESSAAAPGELISGAAAHVRVTRVDAHTLRGKTQLDELLAKMGIEATVTVRRAHGSDKPGATPPPMILDVAGEDLGLLIGWRGETLRSLQTVLNLMLGDDLRPGGEPRRVIVDVERYRARREEQVRELAIRLADRVKRGGERYTLDPMHAYERRIVHLALEGDEGVRTESSGKEPARRIVIHPTGPAQGGDEPEPQRRSWRDR